MDDRGEGSVLFRLPPKRLLVGLVCGIGGFGFRQIEQIVRGVSSDSLGSSRDVFGYRTYTMSELGSGLCH